jgi:hypothetical protein
MLGEVVYSSYRLSYKIMRLISQIKFNNHKDFKKNVKLNYMVDVVVHNILYSPIHNKFYYLKTITLIEALKNLHSSYLNIYRHQVHSGNNDEYNKPNDNSDSSDSEGSDGDFTHFLDDSVERNIYTDSIPYRFLIGTIVDFYFADNTIKIISLVLFIDDKLSPTPPGTLIVSAPKFSLSSLAKLFADPDGFLDTIPPLTPLNLNETVNNCFDLLIRAPSITTRINDFEICFYIKLLCAGFSCINILNWDKKNFNTNDLYVKPPIPKTFKERIDKGLIYTIGGSGYDELNIASTIDPCYVVICMYKWWDNKDQGDTEKITIENINTYNLPKRPIIIFEIHTRKYIDEMHNEKIGLYLNMIDIMINKIADCGMILFRSRIFAYSLCHSTNLLTENNNIKPYSLLQSLHLRKIIEKNKLHHIGYIKDDEHTTYHVFCKSNTIGATGVKNIRYLQYGLKSPFIAKYDGT